MNDSYRMAQVSLGILPTGSPTALFPTECSSHPRRVAGKPRRDLRAYTKGDQKVEQSTCLSNAAVSSSSCSTPSSRRTGRNPRVRLQSGGHPEVESGLAVGGSRRSSHVGMLEFGHRSKRWGFTSCSIFSFLCQRILDVDSSCGVE